MTMRTATLADIPAIVRMAAAMHAESRYARLTFDPARMSHLTAALIHNEDGFVRVVEKEGEAIGTMLAQIMREPWFAIEPVAYEYGVYVMPEHRGGTGAARMIRAFGAWAVERGARIVDLGISTEITEERTGAFYERLGFRRAGSLYSMEV